MLSKVAFRLGERKSDAPMFGKSPRSSPILLVVFSAWSLMVRMISPAISSDSREP
jgi:hypothetical protein